MDMILCTLKFKLLLNMIWEITSSALVPYSAVHLILIAVEVLQCLQKSIGEHPSNFCDSIMWTKGIWLSSMLIVSYLCFRNFGMDNRWLTIHTVCLDLLNSPEIWDVKDMRMPVSSPHLCESNPYLYLISALWRMKMMIKLRFKSNFLLALQQNLLILVVCYVIKNLLQQVEEVFAPLLHVYAQSFLLW